MRESKRKTIYNLIGGGCLSLLIGFAGSTVYGAEPPHNVPDCNVGDPDTKLIGSVSDWKTINSSQYSIFCVLPGDYREFGRIRLIANGTRGRPRYLRLYGDTDDHPVKVSERERAAIAGLEIVGTNWVIDRLTIRGVDSFITFFGDDNILSRSLVEGGGGGAGQIDLGTGNRTLIQGSVLRNTTRIAKRDSHCIKATKFTQGVKIIDNEIYNCAGDGLQIQASAGMLIEDNDFYVTPDIYSDCEGNADTDGDCACAENAIDVKGTSPSSDPPQEDWIQINNNRFWGFRRTDTDCGGTGSTGDAIVAHLEGAYLSIRGNVFFDLDQGFVTPNEGSHDIDLRNNIFFNLRDSAVSGLRKSTRVSFVQNTVISSGRGIDSGGASHEFRCNVFIEAGEIVTNETADFNVYYDTAPIYSLGPNDLVFSRVSKARNRTLEFLIRELTSPMRVIIPNAIATENSPHFNRCPSTSSETPAVTYVPAAKAPKEWVQPGRL